jgi:hypothetical protein
MRECSHVPDAGALGCCIPMSIDRGYLLSGTLWREQESRAFGKIDYRD